MLIEICNSATKSGVMRGTLPYALMEPRHFAEIRDELRATPGAQNNVVKSMGHEFRRLELENRSRGSFEATAPSRRRIIEQREAPHRHRPWTRTSR